MPDTRHIDYVGDNSPIAHTPYERDVVAWSIEQARLLRAGRFDEIDIEHIADEIEDVGKSEERELGPHPTSLLPAAK